MSVADKGFDNIVFDLYGTLIDIRTDEWDPALWEALASFYGSHGAYYSGEAIRALYDTLVAQELSRVRARFPSRLHVDIDVLKVFEKIYMRSGVAASGTLLKETANFFRERSTRRLKLYDGVEELIDMLREKGKGIYLLSNAQSSFTLPELHKVGLDDAFDRMFISSDYLASKPEREFYDIMLKETCADPLRTIMIGNDAVADIKGAREAGLRGIYIHQEISPPVNGPILAELAVMNGDITEIIDYLEDIG